MKDWPPKSHLFLQGILNWSLQQDHYQISFQKLKFLAILAVCSCLCISLYARLDAISNLVRHYTTSVHHTTPEWAKKGLQIPDVFLFASLPSCLSLIMCAVWYINNSFKARPCLWLLKYQATCRGQARWAKRSQALGPLQRYHRHNKEACAGKRQSSNILTCKCVRAHTHTES